jgi:hypothetical protein
LKNSDSIFLGYFSRPICLAFLIAGFAASAGAQCTLNPASPSVTICAPAPNSTFTSPVHVVAGTTSSSAVTLVQIYIDGVKKYEIKARSLDTTLAIANGPHRLTVQAYNGGSFKSTESITVVSPSNVSSVTPDSTLVASGATAQFTAQVQNLSSSSVTWAVDGVNGGSDSSGTISNSGLYTAPSTSHKHVITATSTVDATQSGSSNILVQSPSSVSVLTYHNDPQRTGQNLTETALTPANVNSAQFGKLFSLPVDGEVYAQPLYVSNMNIAGGVHNVVFVATEHDSVYAFDADGLRQKPLWQTSLLASGTTPYPESSTNSGISYELGVTGTPVVDLTTGTLYVLAVFKGSTGKGYSIHALDIVTGAEKLGGPTIVPATGTGDATANVSKSCYQRTGIALSNGVLYFGFAHCGYHGWVLAYSASTLTQLAFFTTTPSGAHGGVWMSGGAPTVDTDGTVYFSISDGTFDINTGGTDYGDSFLRVSVANGAFNVVDYFTPFNESYLYASDADLGSGGLLLLPDNSSTHPHEVFGGGKQSYIYLVDRDNMGKFRPNDNSQIVGSFRVSGRGIHSTAAYWNGFVYLHSESSVLTQYAYTNGMISSAAVTQGATIFNLLGATPSISASGNSGGIVWELQSDAYEPNRGAAVLQAHDASNVSVLLYSSDQSGTRDTAGPAVKFAVPTVANGNVYAGGRQQLTVYGLLAQ